METLKNKKILIIATHTDDEALWRGGLIARAKLEDAKVFVLYVATGQSRQLRSTTRYTNVKDRMDEAHRASGYGGFDFKIGFTDIQTKLDTLPQKDLIECFEFLLSDLMLFYIYYQFDYYHHIVAYVVDHLIRLVIL